MTLENYSNKSLVLQFTRYNSPAPLPPFFLTNNLIEFPTRRKTPIFNRRSTWLISILLTHLLPTYLFVYLFIQLLYNFYSIDLICNLEFYPTLGGWLLVSEVVVGSSNKPFRFSVESSYRGISKSQMFLSNSAMKQLRQHLSFTQLRFYCRKQRTFHVMTAKNSAGEAAVQFFSYQTNVMPLSCGSYVKMADDNSYLAGQCSRWGYDSVYFVGKWGHLGLGNTARLFDHPTFVGHAYHFVLYLDGHRWECDDYSGGVSSGDSWKVFVR